MFKRIISLVIVLIMLLSLCACLDPKNDTQNTTTTTTTEQNVPVTGIPNVTRDLPKQFFDDDSLPEEMSTVIIVGKHDKANFDISVMESLANILMHSFHTEDDKKADNGYTATLNVKLIINDGNPEIFEFPSWLSGAFNIARNDPDFRASQMKKVVQAIIDFIASDECKANDTESDLIASINVAATELSQINFVPETAEKCILILDSGYTTAGYLNMRVTDVQKTNLDTILSNIPQTAVSNLNDVNVAFLGLGNVAKSQKTIIKYDVGFKEKFETLWKRILEEKASVKNLMCDIKYNNPTGQPLLYTEDGTGYPFVSPIVFESEVIEVIPLFNGTVSFKLGTAELKNEKDSVDYIKKTTKALKKYIDNHPDEKVYVVGSIAVTTDMINNNYRSEHDNISKGRAKTIRDVLVNDCGFKASNIVVIDAGTHKFSWRNNEEFPGGKVENRKETAQELNRVVAILTSSTGEFKEIESLLNEEGYVVK